MQLRFLGAAETVTGSRFLLETNDLTVLIDCGLFQGNREMRQRNWTPFPLHPHNIDAALLTHAHIDHSGYLPALVKQGYKGLIHATEATYELCKIMLMDSAHLQEEDAKFANNHGYSHHKPAQPLYTIEDAEKALSQFEVHPFNTPFALSPDFSVEFLEAGHILGASIIRIKADNKTIIFSGDLGRPNDAIMNPPAHVDRVDYIIMESTYGDRAQEKGMDPMRELGEIITKTLQRGGSVLIPSFAVGRAQTLIYFIAQLKQKNKIPDIPVYVDSPMATNVSALFCGNPGLHKLNPNTCDRVFDSVTYTRTVEESKMLDHMTSPCVIISASGMMEGGRILHHLKYYIGNPKNTVVFTGYQAAGTRGQYLLSGGKNVRIHGNEYPVEAEIQELANLSAHSDSKELLNWLQHMKEPKTVFLVHGELSSAKEFAKNIETYLGWKVVIPKHNQVVTL
jgi:metallo-beta-lactamase family protein